MVKFLIAKTKKKKVIFREQHLIYEEGNHNSLGAYILLKNHYRSLQDQFYVHKYHSNKLWYKQVIFNKTFLEKKLKEKGFLQCAYCGRKDLIVYEMFDENKNKSNMATADHFLPKDKGGDAFNETNLVVACSNCNAKKANKIYALDTLKYV